jgi:hypothetical protein
MGNTEVPVTYLVQPQGWATSGEAFDRISMYCTGTWYLRISIMAYRA